MKLKRVKCLKHWRIYTGNLTQSMNQNLSLLKLSLFCLKCSLDSFSFLGKETKHTKHPLELIKGMRTDIEAKTYVDLEDLYLYCYRVASVVGLMMCYTEWERTKSFITSCLSCLAMQLTNICRDVSEDWGRDDFIYPYTCCVQVVQLASNYFA